jgi:2-polyprenyl-3-methyl-5-hydroxy-6-metoxy-1,4-benzoquinol methylase
MLIHKLIVERLATDDRAGFYRLQAEDAIRWMAEHGLRLTSETSVLDLGCGHGVFGRELEGKGCPVTFADYADDRLPDLKGRPFIQVNLDEDDLSKLGKYDLVISSNVLEHLSKPQRFIESAASLLRPSGSFYLSWTNWLSPWGGHEFSPFHYLGTRHGHRVYDRLVGKTRKHTVFENLFPTYIGETLDLVARQPGMSVRAVAPRFYTELDFIMKWPGLREVLAWNCALLAQAEAA